MIPLSAPHISGNEWKYIQECLDSGWVSSAGPFVTKFEERFASYVGSKYAVATSNGTAALHLALIALGVEADSEVLVPTITFAASINAVHYCGAKPVFFDCDQFFNINSDALEQFLKTECELRGETLFNRSSGRKVWGILPVHVFGNPLNMQRIVTLANSFGLQCVEDAAEALGSFCDQKHAGTLATLGCFSFNGNKIITTGGGGMVVTNSEPLAKKIRYLSTQAKDDALRFIHNEIGYNYRLTNLQAAMGVAQLEVLPQYLVRKREIFTRYKNELASVPHLTVAPRPEQNEGNYWLTNIVIAESSSLKALDLVAALEKEGIEARPIWYPNHLQKVNSGSTAYKIQHAVSLVERTVSIPSSVGLSNAEQTAVIAAIKHAFGTVTLDSPF